MKKMNFFQIEKKMGVCIEKFANRLSFNQFETNYPLI